MNIHLRISDELAYRLRWCAEAIHESDAEFMRLCRRFQLRGKLDGITPDAGLLSAGGKDSMPITARELDDACTVEDLRQAVACGVMFAEMRNPQRVVVREQEGRDYILGRDQ